jgi:hypothetical protein
MENQYFTSEKKEITDLLEFGKSSFFPKANNHQFNAALKFAKDIKNKVIIVYNVYGAKVGFAVSN